ncbi:MAG: DUF4892 domain-containing protein [Pseudomonadota bacterium]
MKFCLSLFAVFIALLSMHVTAAVELNLQPYPNAREVTRTITTTNEYLLALGSYKKVDSNWIVDRSQRLSGALERITLELPADHNAENGFNFYKEQLGKYNLRELFHCKARDCGTSNSWANNHFKIIQLYGLDQYQHYAAYEITSANENPFYVVLYAVVRGNKRAYLQMEILQVDKVDDIGVASSPETLLKLLNVNGYFVFPDFALQNKTTQPNAGDSSNKTELARVKSAHVQVLANLLNLQPALVIALVGHDYSPIPLEQQQLASKKYAEQVKAALVAQGGDPKRIQTFGVGSLAPAGRGDRDIRVEVVKINQ